MLRDVVETFETALGPFADPGVLVLARGLTESLARPQDLRVLMQCHARVGARTRPVLLTLLGGTLAVATNVAPLHQWPLRDCVLSGDRVRLAGLRLAIVPVAGEPVTLNQVMPVDEVPRLISAATPGEPDGAFSAHPPVARLGAAATLYDDRIAFAGAAARPLDGGVRARPLEIPTSGMPLRSVSRLMQGARGRPRHVLVDGPDWSQVVPAPEAAPELADAFAAAVNRWGAAR